MSNSYNTTISITHENVANSGEPAVYYWRLVININSSSGVSQKPFLMDCYLDANQEFTNVPVVNKNFIRVVLPSELKKYVEDIEVVSRGTPGWVSYRSATFTKDFYNYSELVAVKNSVLAGLKSNAKVYTKSNITPLIVNVLNLSTKQASINTQPILCYENDTISIATSGGSGDFSVSFSGAVFELIPTNLQSPRPASKLYKVGHLVSVPSSNTVDVTCTITDSGTNTIKQIAIQIKRPIAYGSTTEII